MASSKAGNIAVLGLGAMGLGMAGSLLRQGFSVSGFDVNEAALARFGGLGGRTCTSASQAAQGADAVVIVVVNASQTAQLLFEDGAASAMAPGGVVVASATMAPEDARRLGARVEALGLHYLDAPMSGGAVKAADGQLTMMASGSPAAFAKAGPALEAMAGTVYELGDAPGIGASYKMINQLLAGVHIAAACEAITLAAKLGLDLPTVFKVITASAGNSWMFENRVPHILDGDYSPRSAVNIFTKDLGIISDMGRSATFPVPLASAALQMFMMTAAAGMGRDDDASVARLLADIAQVRLPEKKNV
jgi:3-hydroxyisobutyrate dehydrogenase